MEICNEITNSISLLFLHRGQARIILLNIIPGYDLDSLPCKNGLVVVEGDQFYEYDSPSLFYLSCIKKVKYDI